MKIFNRQGRGRTLLLAAVVVVGAVCVSYGENPPELVGQWVSMNTGSKIELFKDGTGVVGNSSLTWKTEGKRFVWSYNNKTYISDYNLSGYELTRTFDYGEVIVWVRKGKVEEYIKKSPNYFTDSRNDQYYRTVKIGGQTWMAQNLNYQTGRSWCYDGVNSNCEIYGRLYDWNTAKTACPSGWHLPSREEWNGLVMAAGGKDVAGKALKSTSGWRNNGNGIDNNGFSALPGGHLWFSRTDSKFDYVGLDGHWWTATEYSDDTAYSRSMFSDEDYVGEGITGYNKSAGYSVRCVMDN
jgi:uncharacterized protein (TIGR02145 family)